MKRAIRPTTPADAAAIGALFGEVGLLTSLNPQHLHWKYWQPRADWPRSRSFVLASGSDLLAHAAILPGTFAWESRRVSTIQMIDWVARRGEAGAGVAMMKYIAQLSESLLSIAGGAETLRILPHVGFRPAGVATAYVRTLFPSRLLRNKEIHGGGAGRALCVASRGHSPRLPRAGRNLRCAALWARMSIGLPPCCPYRSAKWRCWSAAWSFSAT